MYTIEFITSSNHSLVSTILQMCPVQTFPVTYFTYLVKMTEMLKGTSSGVNLLQTQHFLFSNISDFISLLTSVESYAR